MLKECVERVTWHSSSKSHELG